VSASALAVLFWATVTQHANLRYTPVVQPDGTLSCPSTAKTDGMFGGGALLALDAMLMWFVCLLMSLEARADYLDLHGKDENGADNKKKLDLHEEDGIEVECNKGRDGDDAARMILAPAQSAASRL
jgi:hypothetical protein